MGLRPRTITSPHGARNTAMTRLVSWSVVTPHPMKIALATVPGRNSTPRSHSAFTDLPTLSIFRFCDRMSRRRPNFEHDFCLTGLAPRRRHAEDHRRIRHRRCAGPGFLHSVAEHRLRRGGVWAVLSPLRSLKRGRNHRASCARRGPWRG